MFKKKNVGSEKPKSGLIGLASGSFQLPHKIAKSIIAGALAGGREQTCSEAERKRSLLIFVCEVLRELHDTLPVGVASMSESASTRLHLFNG